jgi:hypothetical protein
VAAPVQLRETDQLCAAFANHAESVAWWESLTRETVNFCQPL